MKSKTSFFNTALFRSNFTRFWPLWTTFFAVMLLIYPVASVGGSERWWKGATAIDVGEQLLENTLVAGTVIIFIAAAIFAMLLFHYLYSAKSAGMYASLPVKRETLFITNYLSGIIIFAAAILLTAVAVIVAELSLGLFNFKYVLMWLGISFMQFILFYSLAVFCGMLTGHIIVLPALYAVLNFMMYFIDMLLGGLLEQFVYGYVSQQIIPEFMSPVVHIMSGFDVVDIVPNGGTQVVDLALNHSGTAVAYAVFGIVLAVVSLAVYKRRHMETATDIVAVRPLRPVFKYCMTFGCALVIGMMLFAIIFNEYMSDDGIAPTACLTLCMIVGGVVGYFVSQMLMLKSFRVFRKGWGGVIVSSIIIVLLMCACEFDLFGYERHIPKTDEIETVMLYGFGENVTVDEKENIEKVMDFHKSVVENKEVYEGENGYSYNVRISYLLKNGENFERRYKIFINKAEGEEDSALLESIINSEEAVEDRLYTDAVINEDTILNGDVEWSVDTDTPGDYQIESQKLTKEETAELYKAMMKDRAEGKVGRTDVLERHRNDYYGNYEYYHCAVHIEYVDAREPENTYVNYKKGDVYIESVPVGYINIDIQKEAENTLEYLKALGIEPMSYSDGKYAVTK